MNTFIKRTLTAAVFATVMLGGMLWCYESFTILFFIINAGAAWEFDRLIGRFRIYNRIGVLAYRWMFTLLSSFVYISFYLTVFTDSSIWVAALPACAFIFIAIELFSITERGIQNIALNIFGVVYIALPLGLLHLILDIKHPESELWFPGKVNIILALLLLIWSNDTFAYLGGSLMGKHKLFPAHSPKKSWEGFFIGMCGALLSAFIIHRLLISDHELIVPLAIAMIAAVIGTAGDLFESMIKRNAGVKDSGSIMPGHGGILDRFDAFLFSIPFVFILLLIINY
jgi:phosphatidate cytidylyltransferase